MRLVFKQNILEKIYDAVADAKQECKKIDYIELTSEEYAELRHLLQITGQPEPMILLGYTVKVSN